MTNHHRYYYGLIGDLAINQAAGICTRVVLISYHGIIQFSNRMVHENRYPVPSLISCLSLIGFPDDSGADND